MVRRFLVIPLLAPWALVLLVAVLNPRPQLSLRLLVWRSPALPIGTWLALVSSAGAVVSLSATALALQGRDASPRGGWSPMGRFTVNRRVQRPGDDWEEPVASARPPAPPATSAGPARAPGEPPPTVSVPFRVIRRGSAEPVGARAASATAADRTASDHQPSARRPWGPFGAGGRPWSSSNAGVAGTSTQTRAQAGADRDDWDEAGDDDW